MVDQKDFDSIMKGLEAIRETTIGNGWRYNIEAETESLNLTQLKKALKTREHVRYIRVYFKDVYSGNVKKLEDGWETCNGQTCIGTF